MPISSGGVSLPSVLLKPLAFGLSLSCLPLVPYANAKQVEAVGSFVEANFPFLQTTVDISPSDLPKTSPRHVVVRGILLNLPEGFCVLFDQELLRVAAIWRTSDAGTPLKLASMAQVSYAEPHRKAGSSFPSPVQPPFQLAPAAPGVSWREADLLTDPRPGARGREYGRGPLPQTTARFGGIDLQADQAVLSYQVGDCTIRERFEAREGRLVRHLQVSHHSKPLFLSLASEAGAPWQMDPAQQAATSGSLRIATSTPSALLQTAQSTLLAKVNPSGEVQNISVSYQTAPAPAAAAPPVARVEASAGKAAPRLWPDILRTAAAQPSVSLNGLVSDEVPLPVANPWKRRIRPADIAFLSEDKAAIVTYDGDVWVINGLRQDVLREVTWERFASGLNEPLSIAAVHGVLQVHTRNGLVRLHDRDGNGEADWYENFSDAWVQSASTRAFPLDMAVAADGSTFISQGGIGLGTPFAGAITQISADGQQAKILSRRAREPYLTLHPKSGLLTSTDQQGNFIPSSVCYLVQPEADFGFGDLNPGKLTPPLVWIPHHEDNSCASQLWLEGPGMGVFSEKLLHLSYGKGTALLVCPDLAAPVPQGAVIPLNLQTEIPLLHARMHPSNRSLFACGFQIYDSRASKNWGVCRIRPSGEPVPVPVDARSCSEGVLISFATPLDPASVGQESIIAAAWNYKRSSEYGSGRFKSEGSPGIDPVPIGQVLLSANGKTVFIHLPGLAPVMQLEINHAFRLENGLKAEGKVYFTVHQPHPVDLAAAGFPGVDLSKSVPIVRLPKAEPPTKQRGKELYANMGCIACHSIDGSTEGKTGPSWKGLFGKDRVFTDGSIESANEFYIRTSILEPEKKIVAGYQPGMASYKGILTDDQIDSLILFIRSLSQE